MKFDIKKHIYLILLFILSFTVETAQSQEVTNIHIAATDTVPTYTSDSAVINFLKDAGIPITQNSKLKLLKSGRAKFIDLFEEIRHAKHHIHLEYFNFRNDSIANALFDLLGEKVKEGVEVRALFDAFGNLSNNKPLKKKHIQAIRDKEESKIKEIEGQRILDKIPEGSFVIPLCIEGTPYSTEQFQKKWDQWNKESINNITFIIGGSLGLSPKVVSKGKLKLSFSRMTFPHQLMRLILIEQLSYL